MRNCFHYINTFFMHEKKEESGGHASTVTTRREKNILETDTDKSHYLVKHIPDFPLWEYRIA